MSENTHSIRRLVPCALAMAAAVLGLGLTAVPAQADEDSYYSVTLTNALAAPRELVVGDILWHCGGTSCSAPRDTSRPAITCARLVKAVGPVTRFAMPNAELAGDDLAKCNGAHK